MLTGNNVGDVIDFKHLGYDFKAYREYAFSISEQIDDRLTLGFRTKILFGKANFTTKNNLQLQTNMDEWVIPNGSLTANATIPASKAKLDTNGNITGVEMLDDSEYDLVKDIIMNKSNYGAAFDFGAIYNILPNVELSASIIDLGGINWKKNTYNFTQESAFTFRGYNISLDSNVKQFYESIEDSISYSVTSSPYTTAMPTKIFIGGRYFLDEHFSFGILNRNEFFRGRMMSQLSMSANMAYKFVSVSMTYSMMNNSYNNFGGGINFKVAPFNMYLIMDNIPFNWSVLTREDAAAMPLPYRYKTFNVRFGLNLIFGCKDIRRDKPSLY
jgi:hypothetical protein